MITHLSRLVNGRFIFVAFNGFELVFSYESKTLFQHHLQEWSRLRYSCNMFYRSAQPNAFHFTITASNWTGVFFWKFCVRTREVKWMATITRRVVSESNSAKKSDKTSLVLRWWLGKGNSRDGRTSENWSPVTSPTQIQVKPTIKISKTGFSTF